MSAEPDTKPCPKCGELIRTDATICGYCGSATKGGTSSKPWRLPEGVTRPRNEKIVKLAAISMVVLFFGSAVFGCSGYYRTTPLALLLQVCGLGILLFGQCCGVVAATFAYRDLLGMKMGRVDRNGWGYTMLGGIVSVFVVLMYWLMTGLAVRNLL